MLEARNIKLSTESAALQDSIAALETARSTLLQERDGLSAALAELKQKVGDMAPGSCGHVSGV